MSFKHNDNTPDMIHLGNYEEFFILYMDHELDAAGKKMVEDFLLLHPDLQAELEILMSTKLPEESFRFDKASLLSSAMKENSAGDELLLYLDNELPQEKRKVVELELAANKAYHDEYQLLQRTKLDAAEIVAYPDKNELYRREEKRGIIFRPWMRVAAAAIVIAAMGVVYMAGNGNDNADTTLARTESRKSDAVQQPANKVPSVQQQIEENTLANTEAPAAETPGNKVEPAVEERRKAIEQAKLDLPHEVKQNIIRDDQQINDVIADVYEPRAIKTGIIEGGSITTQIAVSNAAANPSEIINNHPVTSVLASRKTDVSTTATDQNRDVAKGSVKGFLRKATRLIEKKTGIDPTNDGELLIGAIAINLN